MDVVSVINTAIDPSYASVKTCKRLCIRIRGGQQNVQVLSLHVAALCARSCGEKFHAELASSDLLKEMLKIGDRSRWTPTDIHRMVLHLLQEWAYEIKGHPEFPLTYNKLRSKQAPFEPRTGPMARIFMPYPGIEEQQMTQQQAERPQSRGTLNLGPDLLRPGRSPDLLRSDMELARGSITLLNEVMEGIRAERNWDGIKEEYCVEVAGACEAVKERLVVLLGSEACDESIMASALEINDLAQSALKEKEELVDIAEGRLPPPEPEPAMAQEEQKPRLDDADKSKAQSGQQEKQIEDQTPLINLLDLDYEPEAPKEGQEVPFDPFHAFSQPGHSEAHLNGSANDEGHTQDKKDEQVNVFMEDKAFTPAMQSSAPQAELLVAQNGGNPFADDSDFSRPEVLAIPQSSHGGPHTAPAGQGSYVEFPGMPYGQSATPMSVGNPTYLDPFGLGTGEANVQRRHTTDAFGDLVAISKDKTKEPAPPRGVPMKTTPTTSPTFPDNAASAFDAFDNLPSSK
eukprot:jgi/Picsp_1/1429/NSC_04908-R1_vhs and gat domain protein